ncbi:MAG TPA: DinB family protein [Rugosimonospora sp.]|jgi:uncharacterized damage-inducible protein DinB
MIVPEVSRSEPGQELDERQMLEAWLDYHRATLMIKCAGLDADQLTTRSCPPSPMSLLGLVRHLTDVENGWFWIFTPDPRHPLYSTEQNEDGDFNDLDDTPVDQVFAAYRAQCERSRAAAAAHPLDYTAGRPSGKRYTLRWVFMHLIEEYARHNGHADLLRERVDGATGE